MQRKTAKELTKESIREVKAKGSDAVIALIKERKQNSGDLIFILENLGYLPSKFDITDSLLELLNHENETVRLWSVKTIGKLKSERFIESLYAIVRNDKSSIVKREAVSSIGRMRLRCTVPILSDILTCEDPKIVCQAIRGLLVFKGDGQIDALLTGLARHSNEMVRAIIHREYFSGRLSEPRTSSHSGICPFLKNVIVNGDVRDIITSVPDESVHLTFTSPPYYNARDYSIYPSYDAYLSFLEEVFREVHRITKEGRFLIVNTSPVIIPRISRAHSSKRYPIPFDLHNHLTNIGWEFIDDIIWMKPEYSVKNRIGGFQQHRKPLAYKPNSITEYLMVYRKHTDRLLDWNIHQYDSKAIRDSKVDDGFETTNVWQISPRSDKVHSAVFPVELCKRVIEYYSFKNDLIFDPFAGSGTLGRTAKKLGRNFFLTEKEPVFFEYMKSFCTENTNTQFLTAEQFKKIAYDSCEPNN